MGLLGRILGATAPGGREQKPSLPHIHLEGGVRGNVYVYDGGPLASVAKGEAVRLDVMPGDVTMKSTLTGTVWSSAESYDVPLAYRGRAVGFTSAESAAIRELVGRGHSVSVAAVRTGTYAKGIPEMKVMMPSRREMAALLEHHGD